MCATAATLVEIGKVGDVPEGGMKEVEVRGKPVLLARVKDKYYAAEGRCPHMGGTLALGKLEGTIVTCPRHHSQFDLADGHAVSWTDWTGLKLTFAKVARSPRPLKVYPVKIDGDRINAEIP